MPEGDWDCDLVGTTWMNKEGSGTVEIEGSYASFHGGGFDNWRGAFNTHKDGSLYLVFGGTSHRNAHPGHGSTVNDIQCEPR